MLQAIRGTVGSWIVKILFGLLILSFAVWGIGDMVGDGPPEQTVATVGEVEIPLPAFEQEFQRRLNQLRQALGPQATRELATRFGMVEGTIDTLVDETLMNLAAAEMGLALPDQAIAGLVREQAMFQDEVTGRFSRDRFLRVLAANRLSEQQYVDSLRRDLQRETLLRAFQAGLPAPAPLVEALIAYRQETRVADIVRIRADAVEAPPDPSDSDLAAYHRNHEELFTAPEYRALTVLTLTTDDLLDEIAVDEATLRDEYLARADQYQRPNRRRFDQVVLPPDAGQAAQTLADAARDAGSLSAALQQPDAPDAGVIPLDWTTREDMVPALAEPAFTLPGGGISAPVQTPFGWHVLEVTGVEEGGTVPFEDVREEVERAAKRDRAFDLLFEFSNALDDALAGGASLVEAADRVGLSLVSTPPVSAEGEPRGDAAVPAIPAWPEVVGTAWTLAAGEQSRLEETEARNGYYIVRVDRIIPPAVRPLEEVRQQVAAAWRADQYAEAAIDLADSARSRLESGEEPAAIAAALGPAAVAGETPALLRDGSNRDGLPEVLVSNLFEMERGETTLLPTDEGALAARLATVSAADAAPDARQQLAEGLRAGLSEDLMAQYLSALRADYPVEINRAMVDRLRGSEG
ncbi:MAG: hypothetical protein GVY13_18340 [Alphaproteobacteria bacterium]|jgi:peptidyl-prolyl cis-trans isomerase D|nr:hypothetical protein [Alphaproteobacteria bacterium]